MFAEQVFSEQDEQFVAQVTDIAYQAVLRQGLRSSFVDVELELWRRIRDAYWSQVVPCDVVEIA